MIARLKQREAILSTGGGLSVGCCSADYRVENRRAHLEDVHEDEAALEILNDVSSVIK